MFKSRNSHLSMMAVPAASKDKPVNASRAMGTIAFAMLAAFTITFTLA